MSSSADAPRWVSSKPRAERARQVADVLRQQITAGTFEDGRLPDERVLGPQLGASRNALRDALRLLRDEGLIARQRGVGTSVVSPKYGHGLDRLRGLAETLTGYGTVRNEVLAAEVIAAPPAAIAERLALPAGEGVVRLERLRRLDGVPLSLDTTYLPTDVGRGVLAGDLADRDVFALIEETTGCLLGRAEVAVHAVAADADTARLLEIPVGAAVFAIERLTRLSDGRPVDVESLASAQAQSIVIASTGTLGYLANGTIDWPLAALVGIPELAGVLLGWRIAQALPTATSKKALIVVLLAVAPYLALHR